MATVGVVPSSLLFQFSSVQFSSVRLGLVWFGFPVFQIGTSENLTLNVALVGFFGVGFFGGALP